MFREEKQKILIEAILELSEEGKTISEISDLLNICITTVYKKISEMNPEERERYEEAKKKNKLSKKAKIISKDFIREQIRQGKSITQIAKDLGISRGTLYKRYEKDEPKSEEGKKIKQNTEQIEEEEISFDSNLNYEDDENPFPFY